MKTIITLALAGILLTGCGAEKSTAGSEQAAAMQTIIDNKNLVAAFFRDFSAGEIDDAFALVSDDARWWVAGDLPFSGTKTKSEYLQTVSAIQSGFPDGLALDVTSMIAEGDKVAAEVQSSGAHVNGRTYANKYHFLITLKDGEITEVKEYMDTLHLYLLIQPQADADAR